MSEPGYKLAYDLALACGRWDAEDLLDEMSGTQLSMWIAYQELYGPISLNARIDIALERVG